MTKLRSEGIEMAPVLDTAYADVLLRGGSQMRGLDVLVSEHVGQGLMTHKQTVRH